VAPEFPGIDLSLAFGSDEILEASLADALAPLSSKLPWWLQFIFLVDCIS
jgi:hypothetical protein